MQIAASIPQVLTWWDEHSASAKDVVVEASCVVTPQAARDDGPTSNRLGCSCGCAQATIASSPAGVKHSRCSSHDESQHGIRAVTMVNSRD
jgi:hypothetical protein